MGHLQALHGGSGCADPSGWIDKRTRTEGVPGDPWTLKAGVCFCLLGPGKPFRYNKQIEKLDRHRVKKYKQQQNILLNE